MRTCQPRCHRLILGLLFLAAAAFSVHSLAQTPAQTTRQSSASESAASTGIARGKRVALVVGNANYAHIGKLGDNPRNDADDIEQALRRFGFSVTKLKDASKRDMTAALEEFGRQASGSEAALFYFAGHGMQIRGENYLMPVNASADSEAAVKDEAVSVSRVLDELDGSASIKIVLLDACRDNPINGKFRSSARGLAATAAPPGGTVIAYAAEPGKVAANGGGRNGIFTQGLLQGLNGKDLSLDGVLTVASEEVENQSQQKQVPYVNGPKTLQKRFNFNLTVNPGPAMQEAQFWDSIKTSSDTADYEAYLKQYPNGGFRPLADNAVKRLRAQKQAVVAAPVPPPSPIVASLAQVAASPPPAPVLLSTAAPQASSTFKDCAECPEMVAIPQGSFTMGSDIFTYNEVEKPPHSVNIKAFAIGKTEVTQAHWQAIMGNNPSKFNDCGLSCPVEQVSWDDIQQYIHRLNVKTGKNYRLPSEAEWEYAARAGGTSFWWSFGNDENLLKRHAWYYDNSRRTTHPTASKNSPNVFGVHDMHGNVSEITQDCWNANYNGAPTDGGVWATGDCTKRALRGGDWDSSARGVRSAIRREFETTIRSAIVGFRLAITLP
jgi:formylglycine-generating enzyme required for sulfatase activity